MARINPIKLAEDIARRAGINTALVELTTLAPPPWTDHLSNIHFEREVEDHQLNMALPLARIIAATRDTHRPSSSRHPRVDR